MDVSISILQAWLDQAVAEEDYMYAAHLRDRINASRAVDSAPSLDPNRFRNRVLEHVKRDGDQGLRLNYEEYIAGPKSVFEEARQQNWMGRLYDVVKTEILWREGRMPSDSELTKYGFRVYDSREFVENFIWKGEVIAVVKMDVATGFSITPVRRRE